MQEPYPKLRHVCSQLNKESDKEINFHVSLFSCPESQLHNVVPDFDVTPVPRVDDGLCLLALFRADAARVRAWCDLEAVPLSAERDAAFFSGDGVFQVFSNETTLNVNVTCRGSTKAVNVKSGQSLKFDEGCTGSISGYSLGQDTFPSVINVTDGAAYATVVDWAEFERESFTNARNYKLMEELKAGGNNSVTDGLAVKQKGEAEDLAQVSAATANFPKCFRDLISFFLSDFRKRRSSMRPTTRWARPPLAQPSLQHDWSGGICGSHHRCRRHRL